jgi:lipopolysaccharide export system permease protein
MKLYARYIAGLYLRVAGGVFAIALVLFFVVDFFQKIGGLLERNAPVAAMAAYFALKLPTLLNEVYPAAALLAVMISVGLMARNRELLALVSAGVSPRQIGVPVLAASAVLSVGMFCWNDFVVAPTAARSRHIRDNVIRQQDTLGIRTGGSLWLQDGRTFVTGGHYDHENFTIYDLSLFETDGEFRVLSIRQIPRAQWNENRGWSGAAGTLKSIEGGRAAVSPLPPGPLKIGIEPRAFDKRRRKAKEMRYADLAQLLEEMKRRSVSTDSLSVDLALKLAWPFSGFVTAAIGFPLALRGGRRHGLAYNAGIALALAFAYWITFAVSVAAGRTGGLPPTLAAWAANLLFLGAGLALQMGERPGR